MLDPAGSNPLEFLFNHDVAIKDVMQRLLQLNVVPRSIARDFDIIAAAGSIQGSLSRANCTKV